MSIDKLYYVTYTVTFILAIFINLSKSTHTPSEVLEVDKGDIAILNCPSNDDNHRFQFWLINTKDYIGPGSNMDLHKYKYEVLTGTLYIKDVSPNEHGIYTCFCKHLTKKTYNVKSVELVVNQDWEEVYENDTSTNLFRIFILMIVLSTLIIVLLGIIYLQRRRSPLFGDMFDDESPEEDSNRPHTSFQRMVNSTTTIDTQGIDGLDTQSLDTELPKEFQTQALISRT